MRWSVGLLVVACGPAVTLPEGGSTGGDETSTTSTTVTSTTTGTSTTTSAGPTTVDPGTTVPTDSSGVDSTSLSESGCEDSSGDPAPPPLCGPERDQDGLSFRIDEDVDGDELAVDGLCTVENVEVAEFSFAYTVACDDGEHELVAGADPPIDLGLAVGDDVHVQAFRNYPIDYGGYHFLALRDAEGTLLGASYDPSASYVPPEVDVVAYYTPITFEAVDVGCEPIPDDAPSCGGGFIVKPCPTDETRLAVDFVHDADAAQIWDQTTDDLGPFRVRAYARFYDPLDGGDCMFGDRPYTGLTWIALRPP